MRYLQPSFQEEFRLARDAETLVVDFWAYINARQANLGWDDTDDRVWDCLDDVLVEVKPALTGEVPAAYDEYLESLAQQLISAVDGGARDETLAVRRELGEMLVGALRAFRNRQGSSSNGHRS